MALPTLLYVDDQQENLSNFEIAFQEEYNVLTATSGAEALSLYEQQSNIAMVISDQRMPGMSGSELMEILYRKDPYPIRIIITAYSDQDAIIRAINKGHVYQYLIKPWNEAHMRVVFNKAMQFYTTANQNRMLLKEMEIKNSRLKNANRELLELNLKLNLDVARRKSLEEQLKTYADKLETLVDERTSELAAANAFLKKEIGDRRAAQESLKASKIKLSRLIEETSDLAWETNKDGRITCMGPRVTEILGYSQKEAIGKSLLRFLAGNEQTESIAELIQKMETKRPFPLFEIDAATSEGRQAALEISGVPYTDKYGQFQGYYGLARNISKRRKAENELREAARMESVAVLAGGIAHDFNNILMAIMGNVSMVRSKLSPNDNSLKLLELAEEGCEKAGGLTKQLMAFTRGGQPLKELSTLTATIQSHLRLALAGSNIELELNISPDLNPAEIDKSQIGQAISNVAINAVQAMSQGGTLRVTAKNAQANELPPILKDTGNFIVLRFEDEGGGIEDAHIGSLFNPFFTTKETGSGLGLAVAYQIIKNHKGQISVESKTGVGTTISFYLPAASARSLSINEPTQKELHNFQGKVLLMDDDPMANEACACMLKTLGFDVVSTKNGGEAIREFELARKENNPFDLALLDLTIRGGLGGKETIKELKKIEPDLKAIVMSGYSDDQVMANFQSHGFSAAIPKPFTMESLTNSLDKLLADHKTFVQTGEIDSEGRTAFSEE